MYRSYENPHKLEEMLEEARADLEEKICAGVDADDLIDDYQWIEELKERINFAWQDDEAECEGYD